MALRDTLEQVMRVATYRPVKIGSPIGLLLQGGKLLLGLFGHSPERVLQEKLGKTTTARNHSGRRATTPSAIDPVTSCEKSVTSVRPRACMNRSSSRESPVRVCWYPGAAGERPKPGKSRATQRKRLRSSWMMSLYMKDQPTPGWMKNKVGPLPSSI